MLKKTCLLSIMILSFILVTSFTQETVPATVPVDELKFTFAFGFSLGFVSFGGTDTWQQLSFNPDFGFGEIGIGLGLNVNYRFENKQLVI